MPKSLADPSADADPQAGTHSVFLSYSRSDQKTAVAIVNVLEGAGYRVWWDGLLEGGERFAHTTAAALDNAKAVVVLWSKTSVGSHWVHDEATRGRDSGRLVPLSIEGVDPPLGFGQFQCIDLSRARLKADSPEIQKMLHSVAVLHDRQDMPAPAHARATAPVARRTLLAGGAVATVAAGGVLGWQKGWFGGGAAPTSIAVLPFVNLSGDPQQAYFSDGLASEIRTVLARNGLLQIIGQASSNMFRGRSGDAKSIAEALHVSFLLEGNVQKAGNLVKITTNLTEGKTGLSRWAQSFERPLEDIFQVQSEIAAAVASALSAVVEEGRPGRHDRQLGGTRSVAAFDAYLRGRELFELHIDETSERAALAKFDEAIAIDPDYAAARAARARSLVVIASQYGNSAERVRLNDDAVAEAERATRIAPDFAAGFNALGYALFYGRLDVRGAGQPFARAYALAAGDVDVLSRYAIFSARTGKFDQAYGAIGRALELDPLNASLYRSLGNIRYANRQYDAAIKAGEQALKINPKRNSVNGDIGDSYLMLGKLDKAREAYGREKNSLIALTGLAILDHRAGDRAGAQRHLDQLVAEHGDNAFYQKAQILAQWGQRDAAFAALGEARRLRDAGIGYLLNDPMLAPIREDSRYDTLLLQLGFI